MLFIDVPIGVAVLVLTPRLVFATEPQGGRFDGAGALLGTAGMAWLTQISASTGYLGGIVLPMLLAGAGVGLLNAPLTATILADVPPKEAGGASGTLRTVGMIGGSIGTAVLVTIFGSALRGHGDTATRAALADGIATTCVGGLAFAVVGLLPVPAVIPTPKPERADRRQAVGAV